MKKSTKNLLILHGWASKVERWHSLKKLLEKESWQVIIPSLPGFAKNKLDRPWLLEDYSQWVSRKIRKLNWREFYLLGHSFGGSVAIKTALLKPKGLKGIILISSAGIRKNFSFKKIFFYFLAKSGKLLFKLPFLSLFQKISKKILYRLAGESDYLKAKGYTKESLKLILKQDIRKDLKKIDLPVLIIWGAKDKATKLKEAIIFKKELVNSQLIVYDEVGHSLPFEKTSEIAKEIIKFSQSV